MSYYHYTKGCHLPSIVKDGMIKTTDKLIEKKEKPAAWLTKSPMWETSCNIGIVSNAGDLVVGKTYSSAEVNTVTASDDYMKKNIGMCRIVISESLPTVTWAKFKYVSGISEFMYYALEEFSRSNGSPVEKWLCTFSPIGRKYWESIEMYVDDQWVKWDEKMPIREFVDLCLSCNSNEKSEELARKKVYADNVYKQCEFMEKYNTEIIEFWEANKHKKGYVEIYVTSDYKPYNCGFRFIEKKVNRDSFKPLEKTEATAFALVHFFWEANHAQYKVALPYEQLVIRG